MATITDERHEHCRCSHGCGTSAFIREWSCGCVQVSIINDESAGYDCTDFSGMRYHCGKSGDPQED